MNIVYFDFSAIVLILIMFICTMVQGITKGRTNHLFLLLTVAGFFSALGDFLSAYGSNVFPPSELNRTLLYLFNYLYFFFHNNVTYIYFFYCFSSMGIWHKVMRGKILKWIIIVSCIINNVCVFSNTFNKQFFTINDDMQYVRGPGMAIIYGIAFFMLILGTILIVIYRKSVTFDKWLVLAAMAPLNVCAIVIQFIDGTILIETYALAVEISILLLVVQRQEDTVDPITGAKKYHMLMKELKNKFITNVPFTVVLIRIQNEKSVRVYLGQNEYNKLLHTISDNIRIIQKKATLYGDLYYLEYGLYAFITEYRISEKIKIFAQNTKEFLMTTIKSGEFELNFTPKLCVVDCPEDINEYSTLMTFASTFHKTLPNDDIIHYYRNYIKDSEFIIKNKIKEIIERSFEENQFEVYYQPIYSLEKNEYIAVEALIRLKDRKYGNISPAQFIPSAEATGDIHAIGAYVLDEVCRFISENKLMDLGIEQVQINLSASQCVELDLPDKVYAALNKYKIDPGFISFEISESTADIDQGMVDSNINRLHEMGIKFALDDYGTGYSNVKRLINLPISLIKLGRKFVNELEDANMKIIVDDTIRMFKSLGLKVLVEGIEDENKAKYFTDLGCDYAQGSEYLQGYYFCKPIPGSEFIKFITSKKQSNSESSKEKHNKE